MTLSTPERILCHLAEFPAELSEAWDVPRELSLPGLVDAIGVVRSALHKPLEQLIADGCIISRQAHVVGGGSRRRLVYHLTEQGRERSASIPKMESTKATISGVGPPHRELVGREDAITQAFEWLENSESLQVVGIPGIGRTAFLRELAEHYLNEGINVHWHQTGRFDDHNSILTSWLGEEVEYVEQEAAAARLLQSLSGDCLLLDDLHVADVRHIESILSLLNRVATDGRVVLLIGCRSPTPLKEIRQLQLPELDEEPALKLFGEDIEEAQARTVIARLGGHPLALTLADPSVTAPEEGKGLQEFIKEEVIATLSDEELATLDELIAAPIPLNNADLANQSGLGGLDDKALLRWSDGEVSLPLVVANTRRAQWSNKQKATLHNAAVSHWERRGGPNALIMTMHHMTEAEVDGFEEFVAVNSTTLPSSKLAPAAVILSNAIEKSPKHDEMLLSAAEVALNRSERDEAEKMLSIVEQKGERFHHLSAREARQSGNIARAQSHEESEIEVLAGAERFRAQLAAISRMLDDRLPGPLTPLVIRRCWNAISSLNPAILVGDERQHALVALSFIKHYLLLEEGRVIEAEEIRNGLGVISCEDDPLIEELRVRYLLHRSAEGHASEEEILEGVISAHWLVKESSQVVRREAMRLLLVHYFHESDPQEAKRLLDEGFRFIQQEDSVAYRRLKALRWYWRGVLESEGQVTSLREAVMRFRAAECPMAADELLERIHRLN